MAHPDAQINNDTFIGDNVVIGKGVVIEKDVYISRNAIIYGKAIIKEGTFIGENCIIGHQQRNELREIVKQKKPVSDFEGKIVEIGKNCTIRAGTIIYSEVKMGDNCQTGHGAMIREKTTIGQHSLIGTNCVIDGDVIIGDHVSIQTGVYIPMRSKIGNYVFMGPFSKITNDKYMYRKPYDLIGGTLDDYVSLGANCVIMPGVHLKKSTIVGAGSVVTKDTEEGDIILGNPAKFFKKLPDDWENQLK